MSLLRSRPRSRQEELTQRARREARALSRRQRRESRRVMRAQTVKTEELSVRLRRSALETRRRLRPVAAPVQRLFAWAAPYVSRTLLLVVQLLAALIALILEVGQLVLRRIASSLGVGEVAVGSWMRRRRQRGSASRRRTGGRDVGAISPGLQTES